MTILTAEDIISASLAEISSMYYFVSQYKQEYDIMV